MPSFASLRRLLARLTVFGFLAGAAVTAAGCKQGLGDRCQIDDDCDTAYICSLADHTCRPPVIAGDLDAATSPDAPAPPDGNFTPDATPIDAPPIDALQIDAPPIDAPPIDAPVNVDAT